MLGPMRMLGLLTCVGLAGCTFGSAKPSGDAEVPPDIGEPQRCFGAGLGKLCLKSEPTMPRTLSGTIDTGVDTSCDEIKDLDGISVCVVAGTTVQVMDYRGVGPRPLVIVASDKLTVAGTLDVGSRRGEAMSGAGAATAMCTAPTPPEDDAGGAGGGAGGSFAGAGGDGGRGDQDNNGGKAGPGIGGIHATQGPPTLLRAGCRGGNGGMGAAGTTFGNGGLGGGAGYVYVRGTFATPAGLLSPAATLFP